MKRHVRTFSRVFPKGHPREGQPTYFVEKFWQSLYNDYDLLPMGYMSHQELESELVYFEGNHQFDPKHHTIRGGHHIKAGDVVSFRVWSGKPYKSKQIIIAPDIEIKKTWDFEVDANGVISMAKPGEQLKYLDDGVEEIIAKNDGLDDYDFIEWVVMPYYRKGKDSGPMQIICWSDKIEY